MVKARSLGLSGKITLLVAICCLVMFVLCVNSAVALDGSGTQQDPWLIKSLENFNVFTADANYWSGFTRLETDVNLAGMVYERAVIAPYPASAFTGIFDGNDHKILNLTIDDGGVDSFYLGLFGRISSEGEVKNLGLEGSFVSGHLDVGALVGCNDGNASNCYSTGDVIGDHGNVGGLVGHNYYGSISNCYFTGSVNGGYENTGGLVGCSENGNVSNCYSTGDVNGDYNSKVGGLVGENRGSVSNCYSTCDVRGRSDVGGLVGINFDIGIISNCYSVGSVNGHFADIGGSVGWNYGNIYYCYCKGDVNGAIWVGGLIGINSGNVYYCYSTGSVTGVDDSWFLGGLCAENSGTISNCYSTGSVTGGHNMWFLGGLVGNNGQFTEGTIRNCYSTADVNGVRLVGGLVGCNEYGSISECYSKGDVNGVDDVGGSVGQNDDSISNCFWDTDAQTHGVTESIGTNYGTAMNVEGLPTAEMQTKSTFTDAGWEFIETWNIGENQTYPYLRTVSPGDINKDHITNLLDIRIICDQWLQEE